MSALVKVRDLGLSIADKIFCQNLQLDIEAGQTWAILGPNGVGKTTLLHTLAGLRQPDHGIVHYGDHPIGQWHRRERARYAGILLQETELMFPTAVYDVVLSGCFPHRQQTWRVTHTENDTVLSALQSVGLREFAERDFNSLSGGEKRRVAFAALLAQNPRVWFLDEPGNHLDLRHHMEVCTITRQRVHKHQGAALLVSHDVNMATRFCDHCILLFGAGKVLTGTRDEVLHEDNVSELYQWPVKRIAEGANILFAPQ